MDIESRIKESPTDPYVNAGTTHCHVHANSECTSYHMHTSIHLFCFMTIIAFLVLSLVDGAHAGPGEVMCLCVQLSRFTNLTCIHFFSTVIFAVNYSAYILLPFDSFNIMVLIFPSSLLPPTIFPFLFLSFPFSLHSFLPPSLPPSLPPLCHSQPLEQHPPQLQQDTNLKIEDVFYHFCQICVTAVFDNNVCTQSLYMHGPYTYINCVYARALILFLSMRVLWKLQQPQTPQSHSS